MKYFNRTLAAAIIAGAMSLTSCVENEVAPEVKQMREAQVAYLNARTALLSAQAEHQAAMTAHQQAMTEIAKNESEADLSIRMANFEIQLKHSQMALEQAEARHAKALIDLQREVAEADNAKAEEYLGFYSDAMREVFGLSEEKLVLEAEIAQAKLLLESVNSPWELLKAELERNLAKATSKLAAEEAALAKLEEVAADPATAEEEITELRVEIATLDNTIAELYKDEVKLSQARSAAWEKYNNADAVIQEFKSLQESVDQAEDNIEVISESIAELEGNLKVEQDELKTLQNILADFEAALVPYEKAVKDAEGDRNTAYNAYLSAEAKVEVAQNEYNNDPSAENLKALEDAEAERDTAAEAWTKADEALTKANNEAAGPRNSRNDALNDVANQQGVVDNISEYLAETKNDRAYWTEWKTNKEAEMALIQTEFDDASANLTSYYGKGLAANDAYNAHWAEINANQSMRSNMYELVHTLENYLHEINWAIESKQSQIEDTKASIYSIEESIAEEEVNKVELETSIKTAESELAQLDEEIAGFQAIANKYKALLDTILGGE